MNDPVLDHLMDIKTELAYQTAKLDVIDKVINGNGQPGLVQKVGNLENNKNWLWGMGTAVSAVAGMFEWLFHRKW